MLDPCVPVWCWLIAGEDAVWFARQTWPAFLPDAMGFDAQDGDVCMLRCERPLYVYHEDKATGRQTVCGFPFQCGRLAALDGAGRLVCLEHHTDAP